MTAVALSFNGPISHPATTKLRNALCGGVNDRFVDGPQAGHRKYDKVYLFLNSPGGQIDDGISLFGLLRSLPIELTTINTGFVASIAILPFMAGKTRIALPHSRFHFHDYEWNYPSAHNLTRLEYQDHTQLLNSARDTTFEVLKESTSLTDEDFKELKLLDVPIIKDAGFAKNKGIIHEIKYVAITEEMSIFNVDY